MFTFIQMKGIINVILYTKSLVYESYIGIFILIGTNYFELDFKIYSFECDVTI